MCVGSVCAEALFQSYEYSPLIDALVAFLCGLILGENANLRFGRRCSTVRTDPSVRFCAYALGAPLGLFVLYPAFTFSNYGWLHRLVGATTVLLISAVCLIHVMAEHRTTVGLRSTQASRGSA